MEKILNTKKKNTTAKLLTLKEASKWASKHLKKDVTTSNISYLIQYGKVGKIGDNGTTQVVKEELVKYYGKLNTSNEQKWKDKFGDDLNWALSFSQYKESETTKHVNRLHPYKGKFIPQLVEYFLDDHVDEFKKDVFFKKGNIILDPFCGSGTTLVQSNELGINGIGIDISVFNTNISNSKIKKYDFTLLNKTAEAITKKLSKFLIDKKNIEFENHLLDELKVFNSKYFPSPDFKHKIYNKEFNDKEFGREKEKDFLPIYNKLVKKYKIKLKQDKGNTFLDKWFTQVIREEIDFVYKEIEGIKDNDTKDIFRIILSRTIRSCRATTHSDLATLFEPVLVPYYCRKHGKICKPLFSILSWWKRYSTDTIKRLKEFDKLKTNTSQICLTGDSREINIFKELKTKLPEFGKLTKDKKIDGVFSSPPYVGLIDYHEQHAYSYDLFGLKRNDDSEIGPLFSGQGRVARESYTQGIADVLNNCKKYLKKDYNIFLVANDKYGLYPKIAELAGMKIVNQFKRPVINRVEKSRGAYSEIIFHMKGK